MANGRSIQVANAEGLYLFPTSTRVFRVYWVRHVVLKEGIIMVLSLRIIQTSRLANARLYKNAKHNVAITGQR